MSKEFTPGTPVRLTSHEDRGGSGGRGLPDGGVEVEFLFYT